MSGITGIFYKDSRPVQSDDVASMIHEIRHRGIDGQDVWCHGNVGLGNVLLETTPESCFEELPYTDQKYKLTIAADARIDNRDELFDKLSLTIGLYQPNRSISKPSLLFFESIAISDALEKIVPRSTVNING